MLAASMIPAIAPSFAAAQSGVPIDRSQEPSLREAGKRSGIPFGLSAESNWSFPADRGYYEQIAKESNIYAPGNEFNWANIERSKGVRSYGKLDAIVNFMKQRDIGIIGHTLLWYHTVPKWLMEEANATDISAMMDTFVSETVKRYRGSVMRWDVINEQIRPEDGEDGLRRSFFLQKLGPGYMKQAFAVAKAADPDVSLCFNEFGFEYRKPDNVAKRAALLKVLRRLRDDKVDVDCLGMQSHLDAGLQLDFDGLQSFLKDVKSLGYKVAITELDVIDANVPGTEMERDRVVANHVKDYLGCVTSVVKPTTITSWGFTDDRTWLKMWHRRKDGRGLRPLPFDAQFNRKEQWAVIGQFLR